DGIVTGDDFGQSGCRPYPFPPCEHHANKSARYEPCSSTRPPTPTCERKCASGYDSRTYEQDKHYGASAYGVQESVEAIQKVSVDHCS
ncbi:hypothetical protein PMAYCL1PPCAC_05679, partial [Pristionchus mayeri]